MFGPKKIDYRIPRQSSRLWRSLLTAFATEFVTNPNTGNIRETMYKIGYRFATQSALPTCNSLDEFKTAMNSVWQDLDWGWVDLEETPASLRIIHHQSTNASLISDVFGDQTKVWGPAILEGAYQKWLSAMGAGESLKVTQSDLTDEFGTTEYQLKA
jgi:hypothetical protein